MSNKRPDFKTEATLVREHDVLTAVERPRSPPRLALVHGPGAPRLYPLDTAEVVIGRSQQAAICIENGLLSRRHVAIQLALGEHRLTDLESANGVYLNGVRVHSAALHEGDTIQIGDLVFVFHEAGG